MIYRLVWLLFRGLFKLYFRWEIHGAEHVPPTGAVILAANHVSYLDPPVVAVGVWRPCCFMAKEELFKFPPIAALIRKLNAFPVKRGQADRGAIREALRRLEADWSLVIFPEGTRSDSGELSPAETGVGMLAARTGAVVVPVYLQGTAAAMPRSGGIWPAKVIIIYGEPLQIPEDTEGRTAREQHQFIARRTMQAIAELRDRNS